MEVENKKDSLSKPIDFESYIRKNEKISNKQIIGISRNHFWIYLVFLIISLVLIVPYFIDSQLIISSVLMSIGAGGVSAVLLGYFIELGSNLENLLNMKRSWTCAIYDIYVSLWMIIGCHPFQYMKSIVNGKGVFAVELAKKCIIQLNIALTKIDNLIFFDCVSVEAAQFLGDLKNQIVSFIARLDNPVDDDNLIDSLEGCRGWLEKHCSEENIKKLFVF